MGRRAVVEAKAFLGLLEVAAHDVGELLQLGINSRLQLTRFAREQTS